MLLYKNDIKQILDFIPKRQQGLSGYILSAVLVLFFNRNGETYMVYIQRTEGPTLHSGHIAFPGGKIEPSDRSNKEAAMRETLEEIGVSRESYSYLGEIGYFRTITSKHDASVHVGWCDIPPTYIKDEREVAEVFEIPVAALFEQFHKDLDFSNSKEIIDLSFKFNFPRTPSVTNIWGLTARITHFLLKGLYLYLNR